MVQRIKTGMIADNAITTPKMANEVEELFGFRNRIINGDMRIDQRNNGSSLTASTTGAFTYTLDRWYHVVSQSSKISIQQNAGSVTPPVGFTNYLGVTSLASTSVSGSDYFIIGQNIEGFNFADFSWGTANARPVTISFWVRSSLTGNFSLLVRNGADTRSYGTTYSISSANTWTQASVTIPGDTSGTWVGATNGSGLKLFFGLGNGPNESITPGVWTDAGAGGASGTVSVVGTNGATWYITGVQAELGSVATPFERRPYGTELQLCQRYYYTTGNMANPTGTGGGFFGMPLAVNLAFCQGNTSFRTTMRAVPTITLYDGNGLVGTVTQHGAADGIAATAGGITQNGFMQVQRTSGSFSNSNAPITGGYTASIEL